MDRRYEERKKTVQTVMFGDTTFSCYRRLRNFCARNLRVFNFRHMAKWKKLNARVRNFRMFNFRCLSNWQKKF